MGPISKSAKKAKTPGPEGKKKTAIMNRKALSEGGLIKKGKVLQSKMKTVKAETPKKSKVADGKVNLTFDEDSDEEDTKMMQKTPVGSSMGKKFPKSGKKKADSDGENMTVTPKAKTPKGVVQKAMSSEGKKAPKSASKKGSDAGAIKSLQQTPKVKTPKEVKLKSMSEGGNLKKSGSAKGSGKNEPARAGGKAKKTKMEDLSSAKLPFDVEDDYDEEVDDDFDMDDSEDDDSSESDDSDGEFDSDDDSVLDDDDKDEDFDEDEEESSSSYSDESEMSFESDDDGSDGEISFKPSAEKKGTESPKKQKTPKADELTKNLPKSTKMPKETKVGAGDEIKKSKTPKSALKPPGTASSSDKKVSIAVTSPVKGEKSSKKVVSTPHPRGTKKRHPDENNKENVVSLKKVIGKHGSESEGDEEPLQEQLSFEEEEEGKRMAQHGKCQAEKRKLESGDDDEKDEEMEMSPDGIYYHCGNLPPALKKKDIEWFLGEEDVEVDRIIIKRERVVHTELADIKKSKKIFREKQTKIKHCYAILKCKSKEDAEKLDNLNGTEFTAPTGKWRSYNLAIYPILRQQLTKPQGNGVTEDNCVHIHPLNNKTVDEDLDKFFNENGVKPVNVRIARRGIRQISKGYAFAWFSSKGDTNKAIGLSGNEVQGFKLNITQARPKVQGPKKYNYKTGSNLDIKERNMAQAEATKKRKNFPKKKKVKTV